MNFKEMKLQTRQILAELMQQRQDKSPFWQFCQNLREHHRKYLANIKQEDIDPNKFQNIHQSFVISVHSLVQNTDLGHVFVSLHQQTLTLKDKLEQARLLKSDIEELIPELEDIWKHLSNLMRRPKHFPLILNIISKFERIEQHFLYFEYCERFLKEAGTILHDDEEPPDMYGVIDLGFSVEIVTLADLNFRLNSLQVIYTEACLLFGINEIDFPLTISKVESGSLWSRIFGESKVVDFIIWFIKGSIRFLHRSFTLEGKLARIPVELAALDQQLEINKKLKEILPQGRYQTLVDNQGDILAKSCVLIAKHTQNVLERETKLRVDSEILQLENHAHNKHLKTVARRLPEHTTFKVVEPESVEEPRKITAKSDKQKMKEDGQQS